MADKTTQARDAARTIKRDTQLRAPILRQYKVDAVNSDGTVDIETEVGIVPNVRRVATSALNAGDTVWCLRAGVDILIVDLVAANPGVHLGRNIAIERAGGSAHLDASDDDTRSWGRVGGPDNKGIAFYGDGDTSDDAGNINYRTQGLGVHHFEEDVLIDGGVNPKLDSSQFQESDDATNYPEGLSYMGRSSGDPVWSIGGGFVGVFTFRAGARNAQIAVAKNGRDIWFRNVADGENHVWSPWRKFIVGDENENTIVEGNVTFNSKSSEAIHVEDGGGGHLIIWANGPNRQIIRGFDSSDVEYGRIDFDAGNNVLSFRNYGAAELMRYRIEEFRHYVNGLFRVADDAIVDGQLDVNGTKNARIFPDKENDPTRALRFAASESNTPGIMEIYCGEHEVGVQRELTLRQADFDGLIDPVYLADYVKLGRNPRVRLDAAGPREDSAPNSPYAWAEWDLNDPRIEIRAPAGKYHVELRFIRNDPPAQGWQHEIEVQPEPEPEEEPDNV